MESNASAAPIAFVGDLQRTEWYESLIGREDNDRERSMVIRHIARQRPSLVVSVGDMVFRGNSSAQWRDFDDLAMPLRELGIPILAAAGNHDWWRATKDAISRDFRERFLPSGQTATWQWHREGSLGIVVIDSNLGQLSDKMKPRQREWFKDTLDTLQKTPSIGAVIVVAHHPRFTNGVGCGVGDWGGEMSFFASEFESHSKAMVMIAGHTHSYEHFVTTGRKHYLVSGGGGGPRRAVRPASGKHPDVYRHPGEEGELELRPFNVIWAWQSASGLRLQIEGLEKGADRFAPMEEILLPWPEQ